jgi:hypothetical protein
VRAHDKDFDSVRLMREIRDRLSREVRGMTYAEQKKLMRARLRATGAAARRSKGGRRMA